MRRIFIFATLIAGYAFATTHEENTSCPPGKRHYRTTLRHIESGGIGYQNGYTTLEVFLSPDPHRWAITPFLDVRGHVFDTGKWAANLGAGCRSLWRGRVYGINAYYDYRNASKLRSNQVGIGLETLGTFVDFRINGYLPVSKKTSNPYDPVFSHFSGHFMYLSQKYQSAMKGANAECGFHFGKSKFFDFYAAAGPYYFIGEIAPSTWGGRVRVSGTCKDIFSLELSDSYDPTFHNKFQAQASLTFAFGPKSKVKAQGNPCKIAGRLNDRMLQSVDRQEIIVMDKAKKNSVAINPQTGLPYFFVFVNNTSSSNGTYESPYPTFAQAQSNSSPNDIIYVFPGNGTTAGMNSGITLQENQKLWGSGINHWIQTSAGSIDIPSQTATFPLITNTNADTDGNAVILAANNSVSGFKITSAINDGIYGVNLQSLDISSCIFESMTTFAIEGSFPANASVSITNNQFTTNTNGIFLNLFGTSNITCSNNLFEGQTSVSEVPIQISSDSNIIAVSIENNIIRNNITGSVRFGLTNVIDANINIQNNTIANNSTGAQSSLASSIVILPTGTIGNCLLVLEDNTFSTNTSNAVYFNTSGVFTELDVRANRNTISAHGGAFAVLATPSTLLDLVASHNTISNIQDNGIAVIALGNTPTGRITIGNNQFTNIQNSSNAIAINQGFTTLKLTISDNTINQCEGSGITSYATNGIDSFALTISGNTISGCQNLSPNAASGISIDQYISLIGSITNNTLLDNATPSFSVGTTLPTPTVCLHLSGNESSDYQLSNPMDGTFNLSPCNAADVNVGTIHTSGTINSVTSCPEGDPCPF